MGRKKEGKRTLRARFFHNFFPVKDKVPPKATFSLNLNAVTLFSDDGEGPNWVMIEDDDMVHVVEQHSALQERASLEGQALTATATTSMEKPRSTSVTEGLTASATAADDAGPRGRKRASSSVARLFKMDDFDLGQLLGKGFFSEVHLVTHRNTGEKFALKTLKQIGSSEEKVTFLKEVELLNSLHHPNILRFRGLFVNSRGYHLLTDFVPGGTLRKLLKKADLELTDRQRIKLALDIAKGMMLLHSKNILHRDLKSKNVLLLSPDEAIIADFGLAKILENADSQARSIAGSPYWMAPEMFRGEGYSKPADVFSFGIVLCEIITRLKAEPDVLPRTREFGLDVELFLPLAKRCPKPLVDLAVDCCKIDPSLRPSFEEAVERLTLLLSSFEAEKDSDTEVAIVKRFRDLELRKSAE